MATAKPGDAGQAGTYDPKKGGKFEPTTKAQPAPEAKTGTKPKRKKK